jgi:hypothetical protein
MNYENLHYRRQFLLTNSSIGMQNGWPREDISAEGGSFSLIYHHDLEFEYSRKKLGIYLLGYLLDPFNPSLSNSDIINEMADYQDYRDVIKRTHALNGKYVLVISDHNHLYVLNDATASKQVCYYFADGEAWIASTPNLISEYKKLEETENPGILEYLNSPYFRNQNKAWFGTETPYRDLYILSPNHLIDIQNRKTERFWPDGRPPGRSLHESVDIAATILKGTIEGAASRYKLHISLTGGWDSRMILSSSRNVCKDAEFYTLKSPGNYEKNIWDFLIPRKLADTYSLNYRVIDLDHVAPDAEFLDIFSKNSVFNRNVFTDVYYQYIKLGYEDRMNVTGVMGDQLLRAFYRFKGETTAEKIASRFRVSEYPHIIQSINDYLESVKPLLSTTGIHMIDWFNWEYFSANWGGIAATEHDIARDELRMVNCRELISTFMLIPDKYRYRDNPRAHRLIVKRNWPELLDTSIEPSNIQHRKLKKILRFLHVERLVERIYTGMKSS